MIDRRYRFLRPWRQFSRGDPVPDTFDAGTIGTMAQVGIIGCPAREPEPAPKACVPDADKMLRPSSKVKRKAVGE